MTYKKHARFITIMVMLGYLAVLVILMKYLS